eukprot:359491-Chlamydomonas_euryale.AAC.6
MPQLGSAMSDAMRQNLPGWCQGGSPGWCQGGSPGWCQGGLGKRGKLDAKCLLPAPSSLSGAVYGLCCWRGCQGSCARVESAADPLAGNSDCTMLDQLALGRALSRP